MLYFLYFVPPLKIESLKSAVNVDSLLFIFQFQNFLSIFGGMWTRANLRQKYAVVHSIFFSEPFIFIAVAKFANTLLHFFIKRVKNIKFSGVKKKIQVTFSIW